MTSSPKRKSRLSRRDYLKLAGLIGIGGLVYATKIEPAWLDVVDVPLTLPRLDSGFSGFRMVQISDIHMGRWMNRERFSAVVDLVLEQDPDLIAITGDFVIGDREKNWYTDILRDLLGELKRLGDVSPTVAVLGNNDCYAGATLVRETLSNANIVELSNTVFSIVRGDSQLHFCGVEDMIYGSPDLEGVFANLPEEGSAILLAHEPDFADISAATGRFDLQISGHSHGGQVVLFSDSLRVIPWLAKKYPSGWHKIDKMQQYTNRGVGMSHLDVRLNCRPEITVFTLSAL